MKCLQWSLWILWGYDWWRVALIQAANTNLLRSDKVGNMDTNKNRRYKKMDQLFLFSAALATLNVLLNTLMLTLVEVGERFIVQFNSRRGRCTQNILKGKDHILIFWRQAGLLLLEDGKGKNITGGKKTDACITYTVVNTVDPDYPTQTFTFYNALPSNSW